MLVELKIRRISRLQTSLLFSLAPILAFSHESVRPDLFSSVIVLSLPLLALKRLVFLEFAPSRLSGTNLDLVGQEEKLFLEVLLSPHWLC